MSFPKGIICLFVYRVGLPSIVLGFSRVIVDQIKELLTNE